MMDLDQLQQTHAGYEQHARQSNYHYRSYIGGELYKKGQYLTHYIGEDAGPGDQYSKRLDSTMLDNQVATTIDIYRSMLFKNLPTRTLGLLNNNPLVDDWIKDTDQEGQSLNSFMKTANDLAMVMGNVWILVDKPSYAVETQAQEIEMGIRAYAALYSPTNVLDYMYERNVAGKKELKYIKVVESNNNLQTKITCWYPDLVCKYTVGKDDLGNLTEITDFEEYRNPLGYVPFVCHAPLKSPEMGIGYSLISDVSTAQKYIYNLYSELDQTIKISSHPTLVKTPSTDANAGAGSIVTIQEDMDPQLKPYLLQPSPATVQGILSTIQEVSESIKRMTHTSSFQATKEAKSGVALKVEQNLLSARLSDISDTIRETEVAMWNIWANWQAVTLPEDFEILYSDMFDVTDETAELDFLMKARASGVRSERFQTEIDKKIVQLVVEDDQFANEIFEETETDFEPHDMVSPTGEVVRANTEQEHLTLMDQGYTHLDD